jgi:hypothetical protein
MCCSCVTIVLQWCYSGVSVVFPPLFRLFSELYRHHPTLYACVRMCVCVCVGVCKDVLHKSFSVLSVYKMGEKKMNYLCALDFKLQHDCICHH